MWSCVWVVVEEGVHDGRYSNILWARYFNVVGVDSHGGWCCHLSILLAAGTCQTPMAFQCVVATIPDSCEFCVYNLLGMSEARRNLVNCMYVCMRTFQKKDHTL